jgi:hypothetical protein
MSIDDAQQISEACMTALLQMMQRSAQMEGGGEFACVHSKSGMQALWTMRYTLFLR